MMTINDVLPDEMTLQERLSECDLQTRSFFLKIEPIMRHNALFGWLPLDARLLALRLLVSQSLCYSRLESLRAQGIMAKGKRGYYCPAMIAEMVTRCKR